MMKYVLLTSKSWHDDLFNKLNEHTGQWIRITSREEFTFEKLKEISPDFIFIPHWSYIIPTEIFTNFKCVVFHMTDLPFGRGGSPLQNLISRGIKKTKISAIKVSEGIDEGDVYLKSDLDLFGSAFDIFCRSSEVIFEMINYMIQNPITAVPQKGEVSYFKRRKAEESNIYDIASLNQIYDYIRMLDCEGYPNAYIENDSVKYEFFNAKLNSETNEIIAHVRIIQK